MPESTSQPIDSRSSAENQSKQHDATRVTQLVEELNEHIYRYAVLAQPTISDQEYDLLLKELQALEEKHPDLVQPDTPTQRVGDQPTSAFPNVAHRSPMLSLDNSYSRQDITAFDQRVRQALPDETVEYMTELKIDGVALSLTYRDSILVQAVTRGDGSQGDEITANMRTVPSIPLRLRHPGIDAEIRGEVYMSHADFAALNHQRQDQEQPLFANPRNATAGSMKQQDPRIVAQRSLRFFFLLVRTGERRANNPPRQPRIPASMGPTAQSHHGSVPQFRGCIRLLRPLSGSAPRPALRYRRHCSQGQQYRSTTTPGPYS